MNSIRLIKYGIVFIAIIVVLLTTLFVISNAQIPFPIGIAGRITVDENPIPDGYTVFVKNLNNGDCGNATTNNGFFVIALNGKNEDIIEASIIYNGIKYSERTVANTSNATQWINISIITGQQPSPPPSPPQYENKQPVIIFDDFIYGYVNEPLELNASLCFDEDGYITKYEWTIFSYPPVTLIGKVVNTTFTKSGTFSGILTVYDNASAYSKKVFYVVMNDSIFISLPPIADFYYEVNNNNITFYDNSSDVDGIIINRTWNINGNTYYDNIVTLSFDTNIVELNVTLIVKDNDGIISSTNKFLRIFLNEKSEKYVLKLNFDRKVILTIKKDGKTVESGDGTKFVFTLDEGVYEIIYNVISNGGKEYRRNINLYKDTEIDITTEKEKKTPAFDILLVIISMGVILCIRRYMH